MKNQPKADYCIEIQFEKSSKDPARVFRTMQGLIETSVLISFLSSVNGFTKAIDDFDSDKLQEDSPSGSWNTITTILNKLGILSLIIGIILLFVSISLK